MRFLICARHYPPLISGGSRRPFLLAQGLRETGHEVDVLAPALPEGERGFCVPHINPQMPGLIARDKPESSIKVHLRKLLYWPDADIRWVARAKKVVSEKINDYDVIITSSPPESIHALGQSAKTRNGNIKWVADLRDNWLVSPLDANRRHLYRQVGEGWLARRWLKHADIITAPTRAILNEARGFTSQPATLMLPQACEPRDIIAKSEKRLAGDVLHFLHAGSFSLSDPDRHIGSVLDVLERAVADGVNVKLSLVGRLTENEADSATKRLGRRVAILGLKPRQRVLEMLDECDILILSTADNTNAVPGKLAEFRAAQKPIIIFGGGGWLQETDIVREDALTIIRRVAEGRAVHLPSLPPTPVEVARLLVARLQ